MRRYQQAKAEWEAFDPTYSRIYEGWEAGRPSMDMIHWKEFSFRDRDRFARVVDLDAEWENFVAGEGKTWGSPDPETTKARRRAALDSVQAFRDAEANHDRNSGMDEADRRAEELGDRMYDAEWALMYMPAPDRAALLRKIEKLLKVEDASTASWTAEAVAQTIADARRLLGDA
ncbi:hypothetical protein [Altericroceibacterium xinjiangense]|uniref:hypothetical protein n=1 Tax=Altericroceibacterium xinjiangense TaxID=762261 RepID=UPI000F7E18C9|nr:hypothetical protein [Altericroceibacterium xinjiangense]